VTISYDKDTNIITVVGGSESVPYTFEDLYNADLTGTYQLLAPVTAGADLSLDNPVRPADDKALKLNIIITNFSVAGDVTLTGQDKDGNAQTETISITANGTYITTKWFKSIDAGGVDCTGTYTIEITQSRWGVVWLRTLDVTYGGGQYQFDAMIQVGDGTTETWFVDKRVQVLFSKEIYNNGSNKRGILVKNNGHVRFGEVVDATLKTTRHGVDLYSEISTVATYTIILYIDSDGGYGEFYSCSFKGTRYTPAVGGKGSKKFWDCLFDHAYISHSSGSADIFNVIVTDAVVYQAIYIGAPNITLDHFYVMGGARALYTYYAIQEVVFKNIYARGLTSYLIRLYNLHNDVKGINIDSDLWTIEWLGVNNGYRFYRQYEFDLTVTDKENNPISGATITLKDKDGNRVFSVITNGNGEIATQTVSRGWYEQATGSTLNDLSPHTLIIEKAGYQTYEKKFILESKTKWEIKLAKAVGVFLSFGEPVINLKKTDPENKNVMAL